MRLEGKVAAITGAGAGIGRAIAIRFAREGALVVASDRDLPSAEATCREIEAHGGTARALGCDVSREEEVERLVVAQGHRVHPLKTAAPHPDVRGGAPGDRTKRTIR